MPKEWWCKLLRGACVKGWLCNLQIGGALSGDVVRVKLYDPAHIGRRTRVLPRD